MSWVYEFIGTKEEVAAKVAAINPDACGATGIVEKGEASFVKYHALALIDALDLDTDGPHQKGKRVRVDAHGSHWWNEVYDASKSATPRSTRASFSLVVERVE